jgi:hypothetical protein
VTKERAKNGQREARKCTKRRPKKWPRQGPNEDQKRMTKISKIYRGKNGQGKTKMKAKK